jgi:hypothetical protein
MAAGWQPDLLERFQWRWWTGDEWTDQVNTQGTNYSDPLPPRWADLNASDSLVQEVQRRWAAPKTVEVMQNVRAEAEEYYRRKKRAMLALHGARLAAGAESVFDERMSGAIALAAFDNLQQLHAHTLNRDAVREAASRYFGSPIDLLGFLWSFDNFFRLPQTSDDMIFRSTPVLLKQMADDGYEVT